MSWTSPLTVASTIVPRVAASAFSMNGSRCATAAFIASADWSTSATISWLSLNRRPTSSMPFISGPLMISSGAASRSLAFEVVDQAVAAALDDVAGEALVEREALGRRRRLAPVPEIGGERRDGIVAPHVDQVLGQPPLLFRNRRVALEALGVHDRVVETGLGAVIEEDRVEHLASGRRQAERDVRDPEDRLALRKSLLDGANALDRLDGGADVVHVARAHRKDERVEDQVAGREPVFAA